MHGHHDGAVRQVAFVGLPFVGHPHADGRLLGMGLALPVTLSRDERRSIIRAAIGDPDARGESNRPPILRAGPVGRLDLELVDEDAPQTVRPDRWIGVPGHGAGDVDDRRVRAARRWATVTPIVLDRFPHRGDDVAVMVAASCVDAGLPQPAHVEVFRQPAVEGGIVLRPSEAVRRRGEVRRLPTRHAVISFQQRIQGPVIVGSMRHYGLGLCAPLDRVDREAGDIER